MATNINMTRYDYGDYYRDRETVAATFHDRGAAERAINALKDMGYGGDQIGVAMRDRDAQGRLADDTGVSGSNVAGGAATGALGGGLLGGALGWLVGIGALAIPGIGPVVAGGALATAFGVAGGTAVAGAGIGAATGGIVGGLVGMGIPEEEARYHETGFREGRTLVTVRTGAGQASEVVDVLRSYGGDIGPASQRGTTLTSGSGASAGATGGTTGATMGGATTTTSSMLRDDDTMRGTGSDHSAWDHASTRYRQDWETQRGTSGRRWEEVEPGHRYAHEMASDERYRGRDWNEVEPELRGGYSDWSSRSGYQGNDKAWDDLKDEIRDAWHRVHR